MSSSPRLTAIEWVMPRRDSRLSGRSYRKLVVPLTTTTKDEKEDVTMMKFKASLIGVLAIVATLFVQSSTVAAAQSESPPGSNGQHSALANLQEVINARLAGHPSTNPSAPLVGMSSTSASTVLSQSGVQPPSSPTECGGEGWIESEWNHRYVTAELGWEGGSEAGEGWWGMLRARATEVGPWEEWQMCYNSHNGKYSLFSDANHRWVSTEISDNGNEYGMLRARSYSVGAWEEYTLDAFSDVFAFKANANGLWVTTEEWGSPPPVYNWMLRARASEIGEWQVFYGNDQT